jgi:hypothetical protein
MADWKTITMSHGSDRETYGTLGINRENER